MDFDFTTASKAIGTRFISKQLITKTTDNDYWVLFATDVRRVLFELLALSKALLQQLGDLVVPGIRLLSVIIGLILC